jgi:hypothetical protein
VNIIVLLISSSECSLLIYRKATSFCLFTFYPAKFLNLFMSSKYSFVEVLGPFRYQIMLFANGDNLTCPSLLESLVFLSPVLSSWLGTSVLY